MNFFLHVLIISDYISYKSLMDQNIKHMQTCNTCKKYFVLKVKTIFFGLYYFLEG